LCQTYSDYEIIIVNDGSPDNSQQIIDRYTENYPDRIKGYIKGNGGLSDARNYGIERANGDYLMFVDSDDYIDSGLLEALASSLEKNQVDVIRFSAQLTYEDGRKGEIISAPEINCVNGESAINLLIDNKQYFEPAPFYAYKTSYWKENGFSFSVGRYHEDFGLIPEIIMKAGSFSAVKHIGYFYVQSSESIMRTQTEEKERRRAFDGLHHFDSLYANAEKVIKDDKIRKKFNSYIANSIITRLGYVFGQTKEEYLKALRERRVAELLLDDTFKRKIKKILIKLKYRF
jgi:glycosyltransferase involved in cell wall biosynthesis